MNLATNQRCPELKFAEGVRKGTPLDDAGDYKIVKFAGEEVAQFLNGKKARFFREVNGVLPRPGMEERIGSVIDKCHNEWVANGTVKEKPSVPDVKEWHGAELIATAVGMAHPEVATSRMTFGEGHLVTTNVAKPEEEIHEKLNGPYKFKIRMYRKSGRRPMDPHDPVYQLVSADERVKMDFKREEVGTGLREIAWLYEKYRIHGKLGRLRAFWKAIDLYLL